MGGRKIALASVLTGGQTPCDAGNIVSGSDVTTSRPEGAVLIQIGKVSMQHTGNVTITKDFEVSKGAELEV